ncbi:serine palmitoyl CoA transferase subunit LcbA [Zymoseptoria tritici IPO323]|uniref:serine C-palmitoyltransferase n=1 Tax=Zymoseptoria tritici (strain CBS 115943 / IPO323) TaxID=336722 RepID=F9XLZ6_ZYMTI|nr:serine palmitoyl CoA transferase subunit LcbA [Zymoseptoria tritici IPO323]EGP84003.1 serine palmitoyl CoA transferase subunit LcbA [Zymoseptoria tritici IPO323]
MEHTSSPAYTATLIDSGRWLAQQIVSTLRRASDGAVLARYIRASYQDDPVRSAFELLLFLLLLRYLLASKYSPKKVGSHVVLSEKEIDEMVEDWEPEPLVQEQSEPLLQLDRNRPSLHRDAPCGPRTKLCDGKTVTNLANYNHYNLSTDPALVQSAVDTIRTYGVGPCSAPGFIGTFDVHLKLEQDIASHFGTEGAVIYSQSFSTISSVISAFCKRGDIIVADRAVNFPIRKGIQASRGIIRWFQHNDMEDLERVLASLVAEDRPLTRRFIITEGLSENVGDIVDLPRLLELKTKYKFRVVLDETWSYGILGRTGRGVSELQNVDSANIDIIVGSLAGCLSSGGGFCTGRSIMVEHQRLNSPAVTFSASLPTFLATTASAVITRLQSEDGANDIRTLQERITVLRLQLQESAWVYCTSAPDNPVIHLVLKKEHVRKRCLTRLEQELLLQECVDECLVSHSILVTRLKTMPIMDGLHPRDVAKEYQPDPAIKVCATTGLSKKETSKAGTAIRQAITTVMKRAKWQRGTA